MPSVTLELDLQPCRLSERAFPTFDRANWTLGTSDERADPHRRTAARATKRWRAPTSREAGCSMQQVQELAALDTRVGVGGARGRARDVGGERRHGAAGERGPTRSPTSASRRRVDAARAVGLAAAPAAGRGQPRARRARPAGGPGPRRAAARAAARRRPRGRGTPVVGQSPQPAPTPQQQQQGTGSVHKRGRAGAAADGDQVVMTRYRVAMESGTSPRGRHDRSGSRSH